MFTPPKRGEIRRKQAWEEEIGICFSDFRNFDLFFLPNQENYACTMGEHGLL